MKKIKPNTLFSLFEVGDEEVYEEHGEQSVLDNPYVLLGMVSKGFENWILMDMLYERKYPQRYSSVKRSIKKNYFNKLYGYIEKLDLNSLDTYKIGDSYELSQTVYALNFLLYYFEQKEIYENCAVIKNLTDRLKDKVV
tara:strand:+ start:6003 stop:6419 length:417 start_codon:yes stop_codon:yes gene_type:complete